MRSDHYREYFSAENMMGPNSLRLVDRLLTAYPLVCTPDSLVLDLGCGRGVTSLFIARETGAKVYANDLWISEEENRARFERWGMADRLIPVHEDANELHFERKMFDALVSVDSYHYFAGRKGFFQEKIMPFLKPGSIALIAVPGMKEAFSGRSEELIGAWLQDEAYMFQSPSFWKDVIGEDDAIAEVRTWEMEGFGQAWQEWFDTKHEFAVNDQKFYDELIRPYTAFVGIMVRLK